MGEFADRVNSMRVRASTHDGAVAAELFDRDQLSLTFLQGWYALCDDRDLEQRLDILAPRLFVERTRMYWRIFSDVTGEETFGGDKPISERDVAWREERDALVARGYSADGRVSIKSVGLRGWDVQLTPGTVRALTEQQFALCVGQAAADLIKDQTSQIAALSNKYYGDSR